jgi:hypothetical protein
MMTMTTTTTTTMMMMMMMKTTMMVVVVVVGCEFTGSTKNADPLKSTAGLCRSSQSRHGATTGT